VALFSYFYSIKIDACDRRLVNNFYCALFHDLPEVLTRDIISPVKYSVSGLEHIVNNYEVELINKKILPLVPLELRDYFSYLLGLDYESVRKNEFRNRIKNEHMIQAVNNICDYNEDRYEAIDGEALKACDHLAAFTEAALSKNYGISSRELDDGFLIKNKYHQPIGGVNFADIMTSFTKYLTASEGK
jgi:putative hydrolase of HD superfamily